jgi:hypothetical protein
MVLQWCYSGVTEVIEESDGHHIPPDGQSNQGRAGHLHNGVIVVVLWSYHCVTMVLLWCYYGVTVVLQWRYSGVTVALQ